MLKYFQKKVHIEINPTQKILNGRLLNANATFRMLHFDRIDVAEGTDVNKNSTSKECDICHYWYFLSKSFKFQPIVCDRCHDLLMMSINLIDIAVLNIEGSDYACIISLIRKNKAINLMENADLDEKSGAL